MSMFESKGDWEFAERVQHAASVVSEELPKIRKALETIASKNSSDKETIGCLIDVVEDFLTEKGIVNDNEVFIEGDDYDKLAASFKKIINF